jgi:hypothetical protein|tara:strand:- start:347 stop:574 length:228 start_codon:yes stop_codon:yes gene_type:complete
MSNLATLDLIETITSDVCDMDFPTLLETAKSFQEDKTVPVWTLENHNNPESLDELIDFVIEKTFDAEMDKECLFL